MPLVERIKAALGRGTESRSYTYQCLICREEFVSDEAHMARVSCPGCGASDVRSVANEA